MIACTASSTGASWRLTPGTTDIKIEPGLYARTLGTGKRPAHQANTAASRSNSGEELDFSIQDAPSARSNRATFAPPLPVKIRVLLVALSTGYDRTPNRLNCPRL